MENIDWSKAPEGATHFRDRIGIYYKQTDRAYVWSAGRWGLLANDLGEFSWSANLIVRPSLAWPGQGLPPVGTVCEGGRARTGAFNECVVVAHRNGMAIAVFTDQEELQWVSEFRPIRTPEQIAADERESAIKEMTASYADKSEALAGWAAYVYDTLGYRKP